MTMVKQVFCELYSFRELLWAWTQREIRVRYKQATLGIGWAILQPFSMMIIFTVVFGFFVQVPTGGIPYPIFSYSALLPWTFFSVGINTSVTSLINNMNLVTKIYFPREIFPFSAIGAAFLDYLLACVLLLVLILIYRIPFYPTLLLLPVLITIQLMLMIGISLIVSAMTVFFRDIRYLVPLGLQIWLYLCPIIYPIERIPARFLPIYMLNPMASLIDSYRRVTIMGELPLWNYLGIAAILSAIILFVGYGYFKRVEPKFADLI
jgi:lipopolysaccharide transport system permease protein